MTPDFFRISGEGVQTRSTDLQHLLDISGTDCSLDDFKVTKLNKVAAVVTFKAVPASSPVNSGLHQIPPTILRSG